MTLGALRPTPLVEQAIAHLREQITEGHWPVGTKIPGETTLAKTLGVGRSTVREALRALSEAGLLRARQGSGVFVIATEPEEDWPARLRRAEITDVYEVRMLVEVQAARLAAERRTEDDVTALRAAMEARREAVGGGDAAFVDADIALHAVVVDAAHNPVLTSLFAEFRPVLRAGLIDMLELTGLRNRDRACGEAGHETLVDAVVRGDAERAGQALQTELAGTQAQLRSL
ncbi:FadR/GntR family transcriptional regulator [Streptomyces sp. NPDC048442]|uniref:FadR/GntR family transcriptional regulator n=1 Tax=Streptomyces sp. NPDC048442 TaxID=3154823 RepID=UPI0034210E0F